MIPRWSAEYLVVPPQPEEGLAALEAACARHGVALAVRCSGAVRLEAAADATSAVRAIEEELRVNLWPRPAFEKDRPFLFVFDLDSTLIRLETIDELAALGGVEAEVRVAGRGARPGRLMVW